MASSISNITMRRIASQQMRRLASRTAVLGPRILGGAPRAYSTETSADAPPPPLLSQLKADLKTAMRAKDMARLSVLRSVLAMTNSAAKTDKPIRTDVQLVALLRRAMQGNVEAAAEARKAGRADLVDKEEAQMRIIESYVARGGFREASAGEMTAAAREAVAAVLGGDAETRAKRNGEVIARLMRRRWEDEGLVIDRAKLVEIANEVYKEELSKEQSSTS